MARHFSPYPCFIPSIGLVLILFGLPVWTVADTPTATSYSFQILYFVPTSINASGQVAGVTSGFHSYSLVYSNGTFTTLDVPGANITEAVSINDSGQVAGSYGSSSLNRGFVYSNGAFTTLDVPDATATRPTSINASGQVAGYYEDGSDWHGFVYSNGTVTTLDVPGADISEAVSINDNGQVTGGYKDSSGWHGFVYSNGMFTTLDPPGITGAINALAVGINASGQVAGFYSLGLPPIRPVGYIATPLATDIPTLSEWAMLLLLSLLLGLSGWWLRQRKLF